MPQTSTNRNRQTGSQTAKRPAEPVPATQPSFAETEDQVYGLVSVLYHALQGVQACEQYVGDAERAGDQDLVKFFEECREEQQQRAQRAKRLLVERADEEVDEEDEEDDEDDEDEEEDEDEEDEDEE